MQPAFKKLKKPYLKGAIKYYKSSVSLPIFYDLNLKKLDYIVKSIGFLLKKYQK